jgi:hypothetical protein
MIKHITALLMVAALATTSVAQTAFWSQDFGGGFPAGWTTTDGNNQGVLWTWCPNPNAGNTNPGCAPLFNDGLNQQTAFAAPTAANGFMTCDSDEAGLKPQNHRSRLTTSAINCAGQPVVFVQFASHIGVFEVPAPNGAILRVSTDNVNWTNFNNLYPGIDNSSIAARWSANPQFVVVDISSIAANQPTVYLQWQWEGNWEYFWSIDDVELLNGNPLPRYDIAVVDFFYPVSSFATPADQIGTDTFGFGCTVVNKGVEPATNVRIAAVVDSFAGAPLFLETIAAGDMNPGDTVTVQFANTFVPRLPVGNYRVYYTAEADSTDVRPNDNTAGDPFVVTGLTFSKENVPQVGFRPGSISGSSWGAGNLYLMSPLSPDIYEARTATFAFSAPAGLPIGDVNVAISLLRVKDNILPDFSNFTGSDFPGENVEFVGFALYDAPDDQQAGALVNVDIIDFSTGDVGVKLDPGGRYFLFATYADDSRNVFQVFNTDINYPGISTAVWNGNWFLGGFSGGPSAVIRMGLGVTVSTDDKALPEQALRIFPNPVSDVLNMTVDFAEPTAATIAIFDQTGRVIVLEDRPGLMNDQLRYPVANLAPGSYYARISTAQGSLTKTFVKVK